MNEIAEFFLDPDLYVTDIVLFLGLIIIVFWFFIVSRNRKKREEYIKNIAEALNGEVIRSNNIATPYGLTAAIEERASIEVKFKNRCYIVQPFNETFFKSPVKWITFPLFQIINIVQNYQMSSIFTNIQVKIKNSKNIEFILDYTTNPMQKNDGKIEKSNIESRNKEIFEKIITEDETVSFLEKINFISAPALRIEVLNNNLYIALGKSKLTVDEYRESMKFLDLVADRIEN